MIPLYLLVKEKTVRLHEVRFWWLGSTPAMSHCGNYSGERSPPAESGAGSNCKSPTTSDHAHSCTTHTHTVTVTCIYIIISW